MTTITVNSNGRAPFDFDVPAITQLADDWRIEKPIILQDFLADDKCGCWDCLTVVAGEQRLLETGEHLVQLNPIALNMEAGVRGVPMEDIANEALIHELRHAHQFDRFTQQSARLEYKRDLEEHGYSNSVYERDARKVAGELAPVTRLVLANGKPVVTDPWQTLVRQFAHIPMVPRGAWSLPVDDQRTDAIDDLLRWEAGGGRVIEKRLDSAISAGIEYEAKQSEQRMYSWEGKRIILPPEDSITGALSLIRNAAMCHGCGEVIESKYTHDFVTCSCGSLSVDGGLSYAKRCFDGEVGWTDLSEGDDKEGGR